MSAIVLYRSYRRLAYFREKFLSDGRSGSQSMSPGSNNNDSSAAAAGLATSLFSNHRAGFYDHIDWMNGEILKTPSVQ
jgi:hypothetical protein